MASSFRTRNQYVVGKVETTAGTDAAPDLTNAFLCEAQSFDPSIQTDSNPENTGGLDQNPDFYNGGYGQANLRVHIKGSGAPGTTAPDLTPFLRACGFSATNTSAAITGTATAIGANSITLAAGASATDNFYRGQVIQVSGRKDRTILQYNGTTKVATITPPWATTFGDGTTETNPSPGTYTIPAGTLFSPISGSIPTLTVKRYLQSQTGGNAIADTVVGWQGNAAFAVARAGCTVDFTGRGNLVDSADLAWPGDPTFLNTSYPPLLNAIVCFQGVPLPLVINTDMGNNVTAESDPNAPNGFGSGAITGRKIAGTIQAPRRNVAALNLFTASRAGTLFNANAIWGSVAGNRMSYLLTGVQVNSFTLTTDVDGVVHNTLNYGASGTNANPFIYFY